MRGKEEKKGRGKKEKKRRKGGKKLGTKSQKKKKKKKEEEVRAHLFPLRSRHFLSIRNTLFRENHTISTFVFMQDFFDEQIM